MKLQRHITSKSYLFKVVVEHLMTLCWGIAEAIAAWVLDLLNLFMLPNWRKLESYWTANWANISSSSKKQPQTCWLQEDLSKVHNFLSAYELQLSVWLIQASLYGKSWKNSKANTLYFVGWLVLILFRIISFLNILFVFLFFFSPLFIPCIYSSLLELANN